MLRSLLTSAAWVAAFGVSVGLSATDAQADTRENAFQEVLANPTDPDAMLRYARLAVEDRDYEAVVSTLERLLDIEPGHVEARYELAVAYYALGSYELADFHFRLLQEIDPTGPRANDAQRYLARIEQRGEPAGLSGFVSLGIANSDDGTAGNLNAALRWNTDMGGAINNTWRTDLRIGLYSGDSGLDTSRLSLRTGPSLSIDGLAFGARLQPYIEAMHVADDDDDVDYTALSLGARYQNTHGENWSSFADLKFGKLDGDIEGDTWAALVGASYTPSRDTRVRFLVSMSDRDADVSTESRERQTARVELRRAFASPNGKSRRWVGSAFAQIDTLDYDSGREDRLTSVGVSLRAFVNDDVFVQAGLRNIDRDSNDNSLDDSTPLFSLSIGRVF